MLFNNAHIFRLTHDFSMQADDLQQHLQAYAFTPCSGLRPTSFGWITPLTVAEGPLVHEVSGRYLLCARREDKVIPASALREEVAERVAKLESVEDRKLSSRERANLRDDAMALMLPQALPRSKQIWGYISPAEKLLIVGTAIASEAEKFCECLRESLGKFPCTTLQIADKPSDNFTKWLLTRQLPPHFALADQCNLVDLEDGSSVNCRHQDLATNEVRAHLETGKICTSIGVTWYAGFQVTLDKDLVLRQMKLTSGDDALDPDENPVAVLDADFSLLSLELSRFLPALVSALGGERVE